MIDTASTRPSPVLRMLEGLLARYRDCREGDVASYIPELAKVDPDQFGICVATIDGHVYEVGDSRHRFTIQSISKPFVYGLALDDHGPEVMARKVGVEPSGDAFNAISLRPEDGRPLNPMINAGAIATTGQVRAGDATERMSRILAMFGRYVGRPLDIDEAVYESEARTGHRNRAIGHLLRNYEVLTDDPTPTVDVYFRQCAILVDCRDLALMAATLANRGVNPLNGEQAIKAESVDSVLSVMASCGMYDSSGSWIYEVGMPAKSGVGGGVLAVLPGQFGIGVFSPRLDRQGNSLRAVRVCADLSRAWELHQFNPPYCPQTSCRRVSSGAEIHSGRSRRPVEMNCLREHGRLIRVLEAQGTLTLATAEPIVRETLADSAVVKSLIVDFAHATGINASAATLLADLAGDLRDQGVRVLFTATADLPELHRRVRERFDARAATDVLRFGFLGEALESAEDELLRMVLPGSESRLLGLGECDLAAGLTAAEVAIFESLVSSQTFQRGEFLVRQGDEADRLFLVAKGLVGVLFGEDVGAARRIASFSAGTTVGGMAFIDAKPRSASLAAEDDVECFVLTSAVFEGLGQTHPVIYARILRNIAASLAANLRLANEHLSVLTGRR